MSVLSAWGRHRFFSAMAVARDLSKTVLPNVVDRAGGGKSSRTRREIRGFPSPGWRFRGGS